MVSVKPVLFALEGKFWGQSEDSYWLDVTPEVTVWHHRRQWRRGVYNIVACDEDNLERYMQDVDGLETMCICQELLRCPEKWVDLPRLHAS